MARRATPPMEQPMMIEWVDEEEDEGGGLLRVVGIVVTN